MWIERPPRWFRSLFPGTLFRMPSGECPGVVFLTFDDGPVPETTPWILDTLDRYGIKATFFMVGENVERYPALFDEVTKRGHTVGNHSWHHAKGYRMSVEAYANDVNRGREITGSSLFRPPHGWIGPRQLKKLSRENKIIMFDLVTRDYSKKVSDKKVVKNVKKYARDGSIIVFHDSLKSIGKLKQALPKSLEWLIGEGYKFKLIV